MKTHFTFLFCFFFLTLSLGQEQQIYSAQKVNTLPIFPGCDKVPSSDRKKVLSCLSAELSKKLYKELDGFKEVMQQSGFSKAETTLQFVISKEGIILNISTLQGGNPVLGDAAIMAMEKISMELPPIMPAKLKNGTPVNLIFQLPFEFQIQLEEKKAITQEYPVDEIVLFTFLPEKKDYRYEVRLYKNKDIKVYETQNGIDIFLGKFLSLVELEKSEPYKTLMEIERKGNKTLVADGILDGEFYEVIIHNLFQKDSKKSVYVEVLKEKNGKKQSVAKFEKEEEFNESVYAPLIYRD